MCYKPLMRKWMREKLKRRKKSQEESSSGPAPLQPAYFESEAAPTTPEARPEVSPEEVDEGETAPVDRAQSAENPTATDATENAGRTAPTAD